MAVGGTNAEYPGVAQTPAGWLTFLCRKLDAQARAVKTPMDYYNGVQRLAFATAKFRQTFARFFPPMVNNWMKLVVEAPVPKLRVLGFRFGADFSRPRWEVRADEDAWRIWQANDLDAGSDMAHTEAIKLGCVNVLVGPPETPEGEPLITIEHPSTTYVFSAPGNRRKRLAAIKRWVEESDGFGYAVVYLPEELHYWRSAEQVRHRSISDVQWVRVADREPLTLNTIGVVPMVPLENNPDLLYGGRSDLEVAMPIQDAINKYCLDMQVASEFHAAPQRWAAGWEKATDANGRVLSDREVELRINLTRILRAPNRDTRFGQFNPGDVANYLEPIEMYVDHLAAVTQTPAYYLKGKMANLAAEALLAADAGLDDRCERKTLSFGDGWEEVMRVAFLAKGDTERGRAQHAETIWRPVRRLSMAQNADALVKLRTQLSVPLEMCWEMLGWSPQQIAQAKEMMNLPERPTRAEPGTNPSAAFNPNDTLRNLGAETAPTGVRTDR